jgi:hypothetical protein
LFVKMELTLPLTKEAAQPDGFSMGGAIVFRASDDHALRAELGLLFFVHCQSRRFDVNLAQ